MAEILLLVLCATIAVVDDFMENGLRGAEHMIFIAALPFGHDIPSRNTLIKVIAALDPIFLNDGPAAVAAAGTYRLAGDD